MTRRQRALLAAALLAMGPALPPVLAQTDIASIKTRAEKGDPEALNALGNAAAVGQSGISRDDSAALQYYQKSADRGYAPALFNLGMMYELGRGVPADLTKAFSNYLKAAERGFGPAQFNVGNMYSNGVGTKQDNFEAALWFRQAAEQGLPEAQHNLALAYEVGRGLAKDEGQARRWYRLSSERGYARSRYNLALMLEEGRGGPKDEKGAAQLYLAAAQQNFGPAQNNYGIMLAEGKGGLTSDLVESAAWLVIAVDNGAKPTGRDIVLQRLSPDDRVRTDSRIASLRSQLANQPGIAQQTPRNTPKDQAPAPVSTTSPQDNADALRARIAALESEIANLHDQQARVIADNDNLQKSNAQLENKLQTSTSEKLSAASASNQLAEAIKARNTIAEEKAALDQRLAAVQAEATANAKDLAEARRSIEELAAAKNKAPSDTQSTRDALVQVSRLNSDLEKLRNERDNLQNQLASTQKQLTEAAAKVAAIPAPSSTDNTDPVQVRSDLTRLQSQLKSTQQENARLNEEVKRSTVELGRLQRELRSNRGETSAHPQIPTDQETRLSERTRTIEDLRASNLRLSEQNQLLAKGSLPQTSTAATTENQSLHAHVAELEKQIADLTTQKNAMVKEKDTVSKQLSETEAALAAAKQSTTEARSRIAEVEKKVSKGSSSTEELNDLKNRLANTETELATQRRETETVRIELDSAKDKITLSTRTIEQLKAAVEQAKSRDSEASTRDDKQTKELQAKLAAAQKASLDSDTFNRQIQEANQSLQAKLTESQKAFQDSEASGRQIQETIKELQTKLADAQKATQESEANLRLIQETNTSLQTKLTEAQKASQDAKGSDLQVQETIKDLQSKLADTQKAAQESEVFSRQLQDANSNLATKLDNAGAEKSALEKRLADAEAAAASAKIAATAAEAKLAENAQKAAAAPKAAATTSVSSSEVAVLNQKLSLAEQTAREAAAVRDQLIKDIETLRAASDRDQQDLRTELASLKTKLTEALARPNAQSIAPATNKTGEQLSSAVEQVQQLSRANEELTAQNETLKRDLRQRAGWAKTIDDLQLQLNELRTQKSSDESRLTELVRQNEILKNQADIGTNVAGELTSLKQQLADAKKIISQSNGNEVMRLKAMMEDAKAQLVDSEAARKKSEENLAKTVLRANELAAQIESQKKLKKDSAFDDKQIVDLHNELAQLKEQQTLDAARIKDLKKQLADAAQTVRVAENSASELVKVRGELEAARMKAAKADSDLTVSAKTETMLSDLRKRLALAEEGAKANAASNEELSKQNQALANQIDTLKSDNARLASKPVKSAELEQLRAELALAKQSAIDTAELQQKLSAAEEKAAKLSATNEELLQKAEKALKDNERLAADASSSQRSAPPARSAELDALKTEMAALQKAQAADRDTITKLNQQLDNAGKNLDDRLREISELQKDLEVSKQSTAAALAAQAAAAKSMPDTQATQLELETLRGQVRQLETQLDEDHKHAAEEVSSLASQLQRVRDTNRALSEANRLFTDSKSTEDSALRSQIETLQARLRDLTAQSEKLKDERDDLRTKLSDSDRAIDKQGTSVADLTQTNEKLAAEKKLAETQLAKLRQDHEKTAADLAEFRSRVESGDRSAQRQIDQLTDLTAANQKLLAENQRLQKDVTAAKTDASRAGQDAELAASLRKDAEDLKARLAESDKALERQGATVAELTQANEKMAAEKKASETLLAQTKLALEKASSDSRELRSRREADDRLAQRQAEQLAELSRTNDKLQTDLAAAQDNAARVTKDSAAAAALRKEVDSLKSRLEESDKAADKQGASVAELTQLNEKLHSDVERLQNEVAAARSVASRASQDADALALVRKDAEELRARLTEADQASEKTGSSLASLTQANTRLSAENAALQKQIDTQTAQIAAARADLSRLALAEQARREAEQRVENLAALPSQLAATQRDLASTQRDVSSLRSENTRLAEQLQAIERDRVTRVAQLQQDNTALTARLRQAQTTLEQIASAARLLNPGTNSLPTTTRPTAPAVVQQAPANPTPAEPSVRYHMVAEGDSLTRISMRYYGTSNRWQDIYDANRDILRGENVLRPGQRLRIP